MGLRAKETGFFEAFSPAQALRKQLRYLSAFR